MKSTVRIKSIALRGMLLTFFCFGSITAYAQQLDIRDRCPTDEPGEGRNFPSIQPYHCPPDASTPAFRMRQDFPDAVVEEAAPWKKINFKSSSKRYAETVLQYCLEGNVDVDFVLSENKVRNWYHAPWQHHDSISCGNGREYIRGMTRERPIPPFEFHDNQTEKLEAWAVGFYNAPGGFTLGQVWPDAEEGPVLDAAEFPEGTVACKLLFTDGGPAGGDDVETMLPFLKDTVQWTANIYPVQPYEGHSRREEKCFDDERSVRIDRPVYLTQIDIAVKDLRAAPVNWVFGTFMYNADKPGAYESSSDNPDWNAFRRMEVVGVSWGDDGDVSLMKNAPGVFINPALKQSWLNTNLLKKQNMEDANPHAAYMKFHGLGGRLNGPIDNPVSSCISCHARSALATNNLSKRHPMGIWEKRMDRSSIDMAVFEQYFGTIPGGAREENGFSFLDYSMQLTFGVQNYAKVKDLKDSASGELRMSIRAPEAPGINDFVGRGD